MGAAGGNSPLQADFQKGIQEAGRAAIPVEGGVVGNASGAGGAS
jgi:hypothetical protein